MSKYKVQFLFIGILVLVTGISWGQRIDIRAQEPSLSEHHTFIKNNNNGTFTLTLNVKGIVNQKETIPKANILLVVDQSGSMNYSMEADRDPDWFEYSRMDRLKEVCQGLSDTIFQTDEYGNLALDANMALVSYSGEADPWFDEPYDDAWTIQDWTQSKQAMDQAIASIEPGGGTNFQAGILEASNVLLNLPKERSENPTYVIFVSDGAAGFYYDEQGYSLGNGRAADAEAMNQALLTLPSLKPITALYTVGLGPNADASFLKQMQVDKADHVHYTANTVDSLFSSFETMAHTMIEESMHQVQIIVPLSEYADLIGEDIIKSQFKINVYDSSGTSVVEEVAKANCIPRYDASTKTMTFAFDPGYALKNDVTYSISVTVRPSESTYSWYAEKGYPHTGSMDSDAFNNTSSSNKLGFYVYAAAPIVKYTIGSIAKQEEYVEKPVLQLHLISYEVQKLWNDPKHKEEEIVVGLYKNEVLETTKRLNEGNGWKCTFDVRVREADGKINTFKAYEMDLEKPVLDQSIYIGKKNTYQTHYEELGKRPGTIIVNTPKLSSLQITKKVEGSFGDRSYAFPIQIELKDTNQEPVTKTIEGGKIDKYGKKSPVSLQFKQGFCTIYLKDQESVQLKNLENIHYSVKELNARNHTIHYQGKNKGSLYGENQSITIVNTREMAVDAGMDASSSGGVVLGLVGWIGLLIWIKRYER